ncbi:hypothetical protein [Streptomyces klenkii]|uniref:hypothetical protein n=1 Tax=Streptomyces klenkii TaxID=1420899 RepID=UPI003412A97E
MADRPRQHTKQLKNALKALDIHWAPDTVQSDAVGAVMWANVLMGAAEAHLMGAEMDAMQAGVDVEPLREAFGPVRDEVVATASPVDPESLLLTTRTSQLVSDLARAAGPDEQDPDDQVLAAARDAAAVASALVGYRAAVRKAGQPEMDPREFFTLAVAMVGQLTQRLAGLTGPDPPESG